MTTDINSFDASKLPPNFMEFYNGANQLISDTTKKINSSIPTSQVFTATTTPTDNTADINARVSKFTSEIKSILNDISASIATNTTLKKNFNYLTEYRDKLFVENDKLERKNNFIHSKVITTERNSYYENQKTEKLIFWYKLTLWIYLFFFIFFCMRVLTNHFGFIIKLIIILPILIISLVAYYYKGDKKNQIAYTAPYVDNIKMRTPAI
jgi:hypothetical protein